MTRLAFASAAVALAVLSAGAASASDYRVAYGDLNLGSVEGAARFDLRVGRAARAACLTGSRVAEVRCRSAFRAEAMRGLPDVRRADYARAQDSLFNAQATVDRR